MNYGFFDDANKEYVITTPKTPYPWINYLGNQDFFGLVSNTAGGYCFYQDARLRRLTRYRYNNAPVDMGGRYFYVCDGSEYWSPGYRPVKKELSNYECRHGLGYTSITGEYNGVLANQLMFIPLNQNMEVHSITLKNKSDIVKELTLFSYIEFCLWNANDDMTNFQRNFSTGQVEVEGSAIYHKTEYRERRNHYAFYSVNAELSGFDTQRESFLGLYNGPEAPQVVENVQSNNSEAQGWSPIASHCVKVTLQPNEEKNYVFTLGYVENKEEEKWEKPHVINKDKAKQMMSLFDSEEKVKFAIDSLKNYWTGLLSKFYLDSSEDKLNRMVNIWNPYQCMVTFNMSRSASYFESGIGRGMGFRDSNQDLLGFVHLIPERARQRIVDLAATQFENGGAYHQYQPLTKKGNHEVGGGFNDDPLWLILGVSAYIKETGDYSILDEMVAFNCDESKKDTMFVHLERSFYHVVNNLGPHGLPLIGRADWNDCLNLNCFSSIPDESFQTFGNPDGRIAESLLIAGMFVAIGKEFVELCNRRDQKDMADKAVGHIEDMKKAIYEHGCDPSWFLRAYDANGNKVGSNECTDGKIFIESQGYCVMAGLGVENGFAEKALDSVREHLSTDYGIMLQQPAYQEYHLELGEISSYPPGYKENAGIFCHNNPWVIIAETVLGRGDFAFEYYKKIAPAYVEATELHRTEPYVYSQMIAGRDAANHGEAKNSWLTGTAAWNFFAISQWILGIRPDYDGLTVDPCIPKEDDGFTVYRTFRNTKYKIVVKNENHVSKGVKNILVDGKEIEGKILPLFSDSETHEVIVNMG